MRWVTMTWREVCASPRMPFFTINEASNALDDDDMSRRYLLVPGEWVVSQMATGQGGYGE